MMVDYTGFQLIPDIQDYRIILTVQGNTGISEFKSAFNFHSYIPSIHHLVTIYSYIHSTHHLVTIHSYIHLFIHALMNECQTL